MVLESLVLFKYNVARLLYHSSPTKLSSLPRLISKSYPSPKALIGWEEVSSSLVADVALVFYATLHADWYLRIKAVPSQLTQDGAPNV